MFLLSVIVSAFIVAADFDVNLIKGWSSTFENGNQMATATYAGDFHGSFSLIPDLRAV